jgi:BirA family biotin operon repressor/biotin-[acetyl-CoA-carboxylase] ligase
LAVDFGRPHRHHRRTDSTNERAKELVVAGAPGGLVVTADEQTAGRGRRGHSWFGPPGSSLLYSGLMRPFEGDPLLALAAPLAVCEAAEAIAPVRCQVKWPNDVWVDGRKLAGVLVEAQPEDGWAVIGIGLNVTVAPEDFPAELRDTATSLVPTEDEGSPGGAPTVAQALEALNQRLGQWVSMPPDELLGAYRARDALSGRRISWDGGEGVAERIDQQGHLLVETAGGESIALGAGEVHLSVED